MSKIGKKNILLPKDTSIKVEGDKITITGPKGTKSLFINEKMFSSKVNEKNEFQILPTNKLVTFRLDMKRVIMRRLVMGIADGKVLCDGDIVFEANDIRVGLFKPEGE